MAEADPLRLDFAGAAEARIVMSRLPSASATRGDTVGRHCPDEYRGFIESGWLGLARS
jgi:hypothetical protein